MTQVYLHPATPATASPQSAAPHRAARQLSVPISSCAAVAVILKRLVTRVMVRRPFTGVIE
jgi:hypothetical protein